MNKLEFSKKLIPGVDTMMEALNLSDDDVAKVRRIVTDTIKGSSFEFDLVLNKLVEESESLDFYTLGVLMYGGYIEFRKKNSLIKK